MKNTFGTSLQTTLFGESHGAAVGCVLDGLAPGIPVDYDEINRRLSLRRPDGKLTTARKEQDRFQIVSGVYNGKTTGTPLCIIIPNEDTKSKDYGEMLSKPRPSHGDYAGYLKYNGYNDPNGGGHFSGRLTAALVAASGIVIPALEKKNIFIGSHIKSIGTVSDRSFNNVEEDISSIKGEKYPVLTPEKLNEMQSIIQTASKEGNSVGGVIETAVTGIPGGVGDPWFDSVEGQLSKALFAVPAVKGVEFGEGFALSYKTGIESNDQMCVENGKVTFLTNRMGGINGGITNGCPIIFRCGIKPTPTILKEQQTVDLNTMETSVLEGKGRHDPCVALRAPVVIDSVTALCVYDMLSMNYGTDWMVE